jgi:hypothetical protein
MSASSPPSLALTTNAPLFLLPLFIKNCCSCLLLMFLLLLLCDDDDVDDADFAIVTDDEEDDNFAIVVVFNVVLLTLPLLSPFCVNRVLFSFDAIGVVMVVTDNILFSYLFMRVRVLFR